MEEREYAQGELSFSTAIKDFYNNNIFMYYLCPLKWINKNGVKVIGMKWDMSRVYDVTHMTTIFGFQSKCLCSICH